MNNPMQQDPAAPLPSAAPQQQPPKKTSWLYWVAIAVLLGICIYLFTAKNQADNQQQLSDLRADSTSTQLVDLQSDYDASLARLDEMVGKNAALDSAMVGQNSEIAKLKTQIESILRDSKGDMNKARALINQLNGKVKGYEERIAELEGQNTELTNQNTNLAQQRDSVTGENTGLQQKVRLGAVLHASNIRLTPIDLRRNGSKQRETGKAKRTDVLRVTFDIDENRVTESGPREIFVKITGPNGSLLSNAAYGSGVTSTAEGASLNYTLVKQVQIQQNANVPNIVMDWNQDSDYKRGTYNIELYNDGYRIGSGSVNLR